MKQLIVLCTIAALLFGIQAKAQKVTLSERNATLDKIFKEIKRQTGYRFFYEDALIQQAKKVDITVTNATLEQVLDLCLKNQQLSYSIVGKTIAIKRKEENFTPPPAPAPNAALVQVTGRVTGADNEPLSGVTVSFIGGNRSVTTGANGNYNIDVPLNAVLRFSYVGYEESNISVKAAGNLPVALKASNAQLNDVIVVGYGTQKKATVTGAISSVGTKEILQSPTSNVTNSLVGRLPGLTAIQRGGQPGRNNADLLIRGQATYGDASPIVIVDGIERPSFGDIDPNEIETISVLKDASSTAIFGIRGANGVIIVTTKGGKEGRPKVSYTGNLSLQTYTGIPKALDAYNNTFLLNEARRNDGLAPDWTDDELQKFKDGSDPLGYPNVNWFDYLTRKSYLQTQHNVSVSGGTKMIKYFASVGYLFEDGIFKPFKSPYGYSTTPNYTRYNFRSNVDFNLSKDLLISVRLGGRLQHRYQPAGLASSSGSFSYDNVEAMISRILQAPAFAYPVMLPDGRIAQNPAVGTNIWNPYAVLTRWGTREDDFNTIESTFNLNYKLDFITKGLSFKGVFGYDSYYTSQARRNASWAAYVYDRKTGNVTLSSDRPRDEPLGAISATSSGNISTNIQLGFNYQRSFGRHNLSGVVLGTRQLIQSEGSGLNAAPSAMQGLVARLTYNFGEKYFAEFNAAYNGSENFAPGFHYGFFPSGSVGWTVSKENFMSNIRWVNYLKVRGSYGLVGNDKIPGVSRFYFLTDYSVTAGGATFGLPTSLVNSPIVVVSRNGNPIVTWETGTKRNIGVEGRLFRQAVNFSVDLYDEKRRDILTTRQSGPVTYGLTYPALNIGEVYNKGYEVELGYTGKSGNFTYALNTNLSFNRNRIINRDEPVGAPEYQKQQGKRIGQFFGYITNGFYTSAADIANSTPNSLGVNIPGDLKFVDYNGDKIISSDDIVPIGYSRVPEYTYAFSPSISYKGLSVTVMFQGVANVSSDVILNENNNGQQMYEFMLNRWTPETAATADWPALHSRGNSFLSYRLNDFILQNAAYLKLRNAEISYNFPKSFLNKIKIPALRVYLNGQNLVTWTKFKMYLDPENINTTNTDFSKQSVYPTPRVFNFGVNLQL